MLTSRSRAGRACFLVAGLLSSLLPARVWAEGRVDPAAELDNAMAVAEGALRENEQEIAESHYRSALLEGWSLLGAIATAEGRLPAARDAFERAVNSAVETRRALRSLALVDLQMGETQRAVEALSRLVAKNPEDLALRRLLAQARIANNQPDEAVRELEAARGAAPDDLELAYMLATGYLRLKRPDAAERLFALIEKARPMPQTRVLIGRAYRDAGEYDRARAELRAALEQDPRVRHAHYYLGMVAVLDQGVARLDEAIDEFQQELKLVPDDPASGLRLGMGLVEAQRPAEALPFLERAARVDRPGADAFQYLGRCLLALDRPADAVPAFQRALELGPAQGARESQLGSLHYQLALAYRKLGQQDNAAAHFAEAERYSTERAETTRDRLARYLAGVVDQEARTAAAAPVEGSMLAEMPVAERQALGRRAKAALARAYLNLGVMHAQAERFARAAEILEEAADLDPDLPQVQYSLGVAQFSAGHFEKAVRPLSRALAQAPQDSALARMLALAYLNTEAFDKAADLLRDDPLRNTDASLQYAYGLALVRSARAGEAQRVFSRLLADHGDSPELSVVLGQAYAQQGDYASAIQSLTQALARKPDVAEASATLGVIYLKQGRLAEAESALRAAMTAQPADLRSQHSLATVLDLEGRAEEAVPLLRSVLRAKPEFADARYLLGKLLLGRGDALGAVENLEAAAKLAPEDANIRYQLGQAYQKLGREEMAQQQFEAFRQLKEKRRGNDP